MKDYKEVADDVFQRSEKIIADNRRKKNKIMKICSMTACFCLIVLLGVGVWQSGLFSNMTPGTGGDIVMNGVPNSEQNAKEQEMFVPITSLLASGNNGTENLNFAAAYVSIGQYTGIYEKVQSVESIILSENRGSGVSSTEEWYYVSGHTDMQYLIRNENEEYSLWKFSCFENEEYPYSDVLELVYQIDSADVISEIEVKPATMDNTNEGKAIQEQIGTYKVIDREEIDIIYQILSSLTCYGSNHWDMIDYGDNEVSSDTVSSHQAVLLGRYLSIVTDYGNEIDGLKYTAVSNMFYEFTGIAYNRLTTEQAESMSNILGITESVNELENYDIEEDNQLSESQSMEYRGDILLEVENTSASLEDVTELQNKVSTAMVNGDLPFVISSSVYENPYRLHVVVTTNLESDIQKLEELDFVGGILEIEYVSSTVNRLD